MQNTIPATGPVIGLSLSFCVAAIIRGDIEESRVTKIIAGFPTPPDQETWEQVLGTYSRSYWAPTGQIPEFPTRATELVSRLRESGKLQHPTDGRRPYIAQTGVWVTDETQIVWQQ